MHFVFVFASTETPITFFSFCNILFIRIGVIPSHDPSLQSQQYNSSLFTELSLPSNEPPESDGLPSMCLLRGIFESAPRISV